MIKQWIYKLVSKYFLSGCSHYNSLTVRKNCRSKAQAKNYFKQLNIPSAPFMVFYNPFKTIDFVKKHNFPVIVKPNVGGFSRGAHFPINNYWQLIKASFLIKIWWPSSIIESYLEGRNYRIVIIEKEIMSIIERFPPYVIGNGKQTISALIDAENDIRIKMKLPPNIQLIPKKHQKIKRYLKKQNLHLSSIVKKDQCIYLYNKISLKLGGIVKTIPKNILSSNNKALLKSLIQATNANILGVDVIAKKPLSTDFDKQECIFLELNSRPFLKMNLNPRYGEKPDFTPYYKLLDAKIIDDKNIY